MHGFFPLCDCSQLKKHIESLKKEHKDIKRFKICNNDDDEKDSKMLVTEVNSDGDTCSFCSHYVVWKNIRSKKKVVENSYMEVSYSKNWV